jgi:hypothetical protein
MLGRSFARVPPLDVSASRCRRLRGKPHKLPEKNAMRYPIGGLDCQAPAMLLKACAGWNLHQSAPKVPVPADIQGGDVVAEGRPSEVHDALSVRN